MGRGARYVICQALKCNSEGVGFLRVAYLGAASVDILASSLPFGCDVPVSKLKYAHGARLILGLLKRGHEVAVITPCEKIAEVRKLVSGKCTLYLIPQRRSRYQILTCFSKEVRLMVGCLKEFRPDVAFPQWLYQYSRAAILSGVPFLSVGRDSPWRVARLMRSFRMWHRSIYSWLFVSKHVKHLTTISPSMVPGLKRWWRRNGEISVIPNAFPVENISCEVKSIPAEGNTILCVTEWNELKNAKTLIRAFSILRKKHESWRLIVYGSSMLKDEACGAWMKSNGIDFDGIELRGYGKQEDIRKVLFEEADVFCSPTLEESFGMVFVEAMAQGVPCVGGEKSGAVPWVMGDGGVVCDVTNPEMLAGCIERVMGDCGLRKQLSTNGLRRVKENFDIAKIVEMYEKELEKISKENS